MHPQQLAKIWASYREHRRPELAPTTYGREYGAIAKRIAQMPKTLRYGEDYRDYLLCAYSPETAKRTMQALNAACRWATSEDFQSSWGCPGLYRLAVREFAVAAFWCWGEWR